MRPPIVLIEHGDVSLFSSAEALTRYIEPINVRNGEYLAYDSAGLRLELVASEPAVSIANDAANRVHKERLKDALRSFIARASGGPMLGEAASLEDVLAAYMDRFGYTE